MDIFNNHQLSAYEELKKYGPRYYDAILEMVANYKFAGFTVELMAEGLDSLITNQFISSMDAKHLTKLTNFIDITFKKGETISDQRRIALVAWNSEGKINRKQIIAIIKLYVGDNAEVSVEFEGDILTISVNSILSDDEIDEVIKKYLNSNIPAHINYQVVYVNPNFGIIYSTGAMIDCSVETIRQVI